MASLGRRQDDNRLRAIERGCTMGMRRSKSSKRPSRRGATYAGVGPGRQVAPLPSPPRAGRTCEICLVALALGLLALIAGAQFVPVLLLVALALGAWRPRS